MRPGAELSDSQPRVGRQVHYPLIHTEMQKRAELLNDERVTCLKSLLCGQCMKQNECARFVHQLPVRSLALWY